MAIKTKKNAENEEITIELEPSGMMMYVDGGA